MVWEVKGLEKKVPWSKLEFFDRSEFRLNRQEQRLVKNPDTRKGFFRIIKSSVKQKYNYPTYKYKHIAIVYQLRDEELNRIDPRIEGIYHITHVVRHHQHIGDTMKSEGYRFLKEAEKVVDILNNQMLRKLPEEKANFERFLFTLCEETAKVIIAKPVYQQNLLLCINDERQSVGISQLYKPGNKKENSFYANKLLTIYPLQGRIESPYTSTHHFPIDGFVRRLFEMVKEKKLMDYEASYLTLAYEIEQVLNICLSV